MSCSRLLSTQSNLVLATPVDSHCVSLELRRFDATRTSIPSTPFSTHASLPGSREIYRAFREERLNSASQLLWRRRRTRGSSFFCGRSRCLVRSYRGPHFLYLFHLALPFGEALLHSLFSFSSHLGRIRHQALEIRRNRPLRRGGGCSRNWNNSRSHDNFRSVRQCFLSFVQCFLPGIQLRFPLSELLFSG